MKLVNIGAEDLHDGKKKLVLGLTWTLILKYEISKFGIDENMILKWVRLRVGDIEVTSWGESFRDGLVFCALIQHHAPGAVDMGALNPNDPMGTLQARRCWLTDCITRLRSSAWTCATTASASTARACWVTRSK